MVKRNFNEESFIIHNDGDKYILKDNPNLEDLIVLAKRRRNVSKGLDITLIVIGVFLSPLIILAMFFIAMGITAINLIKSNNSSEFECIYYDQNKNKIAFHSLQNDVWYEFEPNQVKDIVSHDNDALFYIVIDLGNDKEPNLGYIKVGYATREEKLSCLEKINKIKEGTFLG